MTKIYLDNAATSPMAPEVIEAMVLSMQNDFGNPSSTHALGRKSKASVEHCRKKIAQILHCKPAEIIFTPGGTFADNLAIIGATETFGIQRIITSKIEHSAVKNCIEKLSNIEVCYVKHLEDGTIDKNDLQTLIENSSSPTLISIMHINNELGVVNDIFTIGEWVKNKAHIYFHSDTVQSIGHIPYDLSTSGIDFITCSAHKIHGPKGIGFLYINQNTTLKPLFFGGNQERSINPGTEYIAGIVGLTKALELAYENLETNEKHIAEIKQYCIAQLQNKIPQIQIQSPVQISSNSILNIQIPSNKQLNTLLFQLDLKNIYVSGGSACSSGSLQGSYVINEIFHQPKNPSIRISFSRYTQKSEIDTFINSLWEIL